VALIGAGLVVWLVFFKRANKRGTSPHRKHNKRRKHRPINPTLAQTGGLPPLRKPDEPPHGKLGGTRVLTQLIPNRNPALNPAMFDHEKLRVYQSSLAFALWAETFLERAKKSSPLYDQLDRARTSILLNIAKGNGRFAAPDHCRFFETARGSVLECAACLDLLAIKNLNDSQELKQGKEVLQKIIPMLVDLIRYHSTERLHEMPVSYRPETEKDYNLD